MIDEFFSGVSLIGLMIILILCLFYFVLNSKEKINMFLTDSIKKVKKIKNHVTFFAIVFSFVSISS